MKIEEAIAYVNHYSWNKTRPGLSRTKELLEKMGNPQKKVKFVHVAGSNGKGSTCAMLESILRTAGYKTGFYLSPYIEDFKETFQIYGKMIGDDEFCRITEKVKDIAENMADHPSQFEIKTAIAFQYFADNACDMVVLETGMGGEFDSTNVIDAPVVAVITNIGLEHTEFLGDTIEKIAATKAGIIKAGCSAVSYENKPQVIEVLKRRANEEGCPFYIAGKNDVELLEHDLNGQRFRRNDNIYKIPLLGGHQLMNVSVVLKTVDVLRDKGYKISDTDIAKGLEAVKWPARFEVLSKDPLFIIDGGHNLQCAEALSGLIKQYFNNRKFTFITGILADKDYKDMLKAVADNADEFLCVTPDSPRALKAVELRKTAESLGYRAREFTDIEKAVTAGIEAGLGVIAFGSLYMAGDVRRICRRKFGIE